MNSITGLGINAGITQGINENASKLESDEFKTTLEKASKSKDLNGLKNATDQFEAYFIHKLLNAMRKTILSSDMSNERKQYEDMLDQKYAESLTKSGGIGLSKYLFDQLKKTYD